MELNNSILSALVIPNSINSIYELGGYKLQGLHVKVSFENFKNILKRDSGVRQIFDKHSNLSFQDNSTVKFVFIRCLCFMQLFEITKALEENKQPNIYTMAESYDISILDALVSLDKIHNLKRRGIKEVILENSVYTNPYITFDIPSNLPHHLTSVVDKVYLLLGFINLINSIQEKTNIACNLHAMEITI